MSIDSIFAIDPGLKGAVVLYHKNETITWAMPTIKAGKHNRIDGIAFKSILKLSFYDDLVIDFNNTHIFLERAQAMPKQGSVSMFNYGMGFGILLGVIQSLGIQHTLVPPPTWHRAVLKGVPGDQPKDRALFRCKQLYPKVNLLVTERSKKPHDGIVDALCILEYGRKEFKI